MGSISNMSSMSSMSSVCRLVALTIVTLLAPGATAETAYSPNVNRHYPDNVYWGDTHLHTWLSGDAYTLGTRLTPDQAYRFARGETVVSTGGEEVRLRRPLDFLLIADHAENLGVLPRLAAGDPELLKTEDGKRFADIVAKLPPLKDVIHAESREAYDAGSRDLNTAKAAWNGDYGIDENFKRQIWHEVIDIAERYNEPGRFTTFAGYEYSSNPPMLHRNVLFAGGPTETRRTLPFSKFDSANPEDLWTYLLNYRRDVGGDVIAIPHNSNLSGGSMFRPDTYYGIPLTTADASIRAAIEPIAEVTQIKGDSETHPLISPDDEFADYETWGNYVDRSKTAAAADGKSPGTPSVELASQSYLRSALKLGLQFQETLGVNPFKLGMIGSTDSHTGLSTADEDNFWGKMGANEPGQYRAAALGVFTSSGYAAVWAEENTRASLFAAIKRREVYATTGPRITLRFFGGWNYTDADAESPEFASIGYSKGVPMGGDLVRAAGSGAPAFLIRAVKDPDGANLDRVQVVKGWRDAAGALQEKIYDVAWSDQRKPGPTGKLPPLASTVDRLTATYRNSVGEAELAVAWVDPEFKATETAFYYVRVIEIATPRWTGYDAAFYHLKDLPPAQSETQERAYSSPIWYTP